MGKILPQPSGVGEGDGEGSPVGVGMELGVGIGAKLGVGVGVELGVGIGARLGVGVGVGVKLGVGKTLVLCACVGLGVDSAVPAALCFKVSVGAGVSSGSSQSTLCSHSSCASAEGWTVTVGDAASSVGWGAAGETTPWNSQEHDSSSAASARIINTVFFIMFSFQPIGIRPLSPCSAESELTEPQRPPSSGTGRSQARAAHTLSFVC